ncbi:MAG: DUF2157 domain-containing protein [Vitreimonas sp.]
MSAYKDRVKEDLDRWIGAGLVDADKRSAILESIPDARRLEAATALAWLGGLLLGIAAIAFVAANWEITPKLVRFATLLAAFLGFAGAGAWAAHAERPIASNILLMVAALVFAASIGLTGQIFDIAGDPRAASYAAGIAGFLLALAGRSTGAATVGLVFIALGDFTDREWFAGLDSEIPWMLFAAPLGAYLALRWGSAALAHASALAILYCFGWFAARTGDDAGAFLFLAILMGAMAAGGRWLFTQERRFAGVFYGWFAWGALVLFAGAGYTSWFEGRDSNLAALVHRLVWLALSGGVLALGRMIATASSPQSACSALSAPSARCSPISASICSPLPACSSSAP